MTEQPSPDARAVVRAAEELTTQVRRIADALTTPVVEDAVATDDAPTTPATTCSAQHHGVGLPRMCIRAAQHEHPRHTDEHGFNWSDTVAIYPVGSAAAKTSLPFPRPAEVIEDERPLREYVQAASEDACLTHRQGCCDGTTRDCAFVTDEGRSNVLLVLVDRAARGVLNDHEATALRARAQQVINGRARWKAKAEEIERDRDRIAEDRDTADRIRAEVQRDRDQHAAVLAEVLAAFVHKVDGYRIPRVRAEADVATLEKWRSVVAPTAERPWWQQVAKARAELEQAQAAIERVRAALAHPNHHNMILTRTVRAALDGTGQPGPEATEATSHHYLSTGCLHDQHDYCQSNTGQSGAKKPASCKFCAAPCTCPCHKEPTS